MRPTEAGEILSMIPRLTASAAGAGLDQWVSGGPSLSAIGLSQDGATIWQICSGVMAAGLPGRGSFGQARNDLRFI